MAEGSATGEFQDVGEEGEGFVEGAVLALGEFGCGGDLGDPALQVAQSVDPDGRREWHPVTNVQAMPV